MTPEQKNHIDSMSQKDMAWLYRFSPSGHVYFVTDTEVCEYFRSKFKGFTPEISKAIGWEKP